MTERPDQWHFPYFNDEMGRAVGANMERSDALLLGRVTYEGFAEYWPDKTGADDPFADYINNVQRYVVSNTLHQVDWDGTTVVPATSTRSWRS